MVTKRYLDRKLVEPIRQELREEGKEEGREAGIKEGREAGHEEGIEEGKAIGERRANQRWAAWNRRRLEAEAKGETFAEPPPEPTHTNGKEETGP